VVKTVPSNHSAGLINQTKAVTSPVVKTVPSNHSAGLINQTKAVTSPVVKTVPSNHSAGLINQTKTFDNGTSTGFQTYQNHILGIKIGYPHSWYVRTYPYNNAANNTVAGFYSSSNTASELGNISGVSGHFVPYVDIFVFDSKNMSLDKIIKGRINRIQNTSDFLIDSKPITLRGNNSAHMLVYSTTTGSDESFKKLQVYTISDNKVYLITFTAQEALFSNYLPKVLKMIDSFEI
jgi:eukaryotic-like serine/threonine-protein kinase